jgi:hypothetical protein
LTTISYSKYFDTVGWLTKYSHGTYFSICANSMCNHPETFSMGSRTNGMDSQPIVVDSAKALESDKPLELNGLAKKRNLSESGRDGPEQKKQRGQSVKIGSNVQSVATEQSEAGRNPTRKGMESYSDQDVLSGRGGGTNLHPGNRHYRDLILSHRQTYDIASKSKKPNVSRKIVQMIRERGGRFLRKEKDGLFYDISYEAAREKTSQALQHRIFEMRNKEDPRKQRLAKENGAREEVRPKACRSHSYLLNILMRSFLLLFMKAHAERTGTLPPSVLATSKMDAELGSMKTLLCKQYDLSSSDRSDKLLGLNRQSLNAQKLQEQIYQDALARQRQLHADTVHQDPAYLEALCTLRQREAMLDLDKAIQQAQLRRRELSLTSGLNSLLHNAMVASPSANALVLSGRSLPTLGLTPHPDPAFFLMVDRMAPTSRSGVLRRDMPDVAVYPQGPRRTFLPDTLRSPWGSGP